MRTILPELSNMQGDEVRQEQVVKKQKEYHMVGQQRRVPGHTLFEFNKKNEEIRPAQITRKAQLLYSHDNKPRENVKFETRVDIHNDCFYLQALNIKNAEKKLKKLGML